ncbi:imelysin family protein [Psychrobium sp. 1_MG-2023]|uniref:imelysin family protein n=1 Tax=Psychrobium sp. 1_MG-2023 TaxID=3062624 RepID=UPI000C321EA6|nr:imelysin family protein [Psychrobium sp. 1_MG-2023]MDP2562874.1 imelysin family protein [Psychrobium sp. 1_MG-2023]PKF57149.1 metalloproteinase [Alteromonadales bacterium alter-6D02]
MSVKKLAIASLVAAVLTGCNGDDGDNGIAGLDGLKGADGANGVSTFVKRQDVLTTNANIAYAVYSDSLITAQNLRDDLAALVANPTEQTFAQAKDAWLASREPYGQTEVYRFRSGPIDALKEDGTIGVEGDGKEGRINAWPLAEAIIDYVAPAVNGSAQGDVVISGSIITNAADYPTINKDTIADMFEHGEDEANVTTGYHAIEFLLWGQDLNLDATTGDGGTRDASGGQRPVTDYSMTACTSGTGTPADVSVCTRRGQYLLAAADLLIEDLAAVTTAWEPGVEGNHYANFVAGGDESLGLMLGGMGRLSFGELAGERINIALTTNSQEDEHSCFSDNTHRDIFLNAKGVQNSYLGRYVRVDGEVIEGASLHDLLVVEKNHELANDLRGALEKTMASAAVIDTKAKTGVPFDNLIQQSVSQPNVVAVIAALVKQTDQIELAAQVLNVETADLRDDTDQDI